MIEPQTEEAIAKRRAMLIGAAERGRRVPLRSLEVIPDEATSLQQHLSGITEARKA
jgi:hypothetical protein